MRFRKSAHGVYNTQYHIVWTPRYRRRILGKGVREYLEEILKHMEGLEGDIEVRMVNVQIDHVHPTSRKKRGKKYCPLCKLRVFVF